MSIAVNSAWKAELARPLHEDPAVSSCNSDTITWLHDMNYIRHCTVEAVVSTIAMNLQGSAFQKRVNYTARINFLLLRLDS